MYDTGEHEEEDLAGESVLIPLPRPRTAPEEPCTMRERLMLPWASVSRPRGMCWCQNGRRVLAYLPY
jgi:hypothetical protein